MYKNRNFKIRRYRKKKYFISKEEYEKIEEILDIGLAKAMDKTKDDELLSYDEIKELLGDK
jgi:ribosome-binding protein aMBF1 (putative translation factor)